MLVSKKDLARMLGTSTKSVDRERRRGRLSWTMVGGRVKFSREQINGYLERRTNAA
jgi:excisionase family DNA binding protein